MPHDDSGYDVTLYTRAMGTTPGKSSIHAVAVDRFGSTALVHNQEVPTSSPHVAQYQAAIKGLDMCMDHGFRRVAHVVHSELLHKQINGELNVNDVALKPLHRSYHDIKGRLDRVRMVHQAEIPDAGELLAGVISGKKDEHDASVLD